MISTKTIKHLVWAACNKEILNDLYRICVSLVKLTDGGRGGEGEGVVEEPKDTAKRKPGPQ